MLGGSLRRLVAALAVAVAVAATRAAAAEVDRSFHRDFDAVWGKRNARFLEQGRVVELSLDERTGSRLESKDRYLFGRFDLDIRLVAGESAGTITSFYICTGGARHDEVDFEFLGNVSGEPYLLHTNIFSDGKGEREQQFVLWFDPTADFHTYSILWNQLNIILYIDGTPIRVFKNNEANGVPFPTQQPVHVFASIWNAEEWATQGGRVKTNWSEAPFVAAYRRFDASSACVWRGNGATTRCGGDHLPSSASSWMGQTLDWWSWMTLNWVRMNYMAYDYCEDQQRYPTAGSPFLESALLDRAYSSTAAPPPALAHPLVPVEIAGQPSDLRCRPTSLRRMLRLRLRVWRVRAARSIAARFLATGVLRTHVRVRRSAAHRRPDRAISPTCRSCGRPGCLFSQAVWAAARLPATAASWASWRPCYWAVWTTACFAPSRRDPWCSCSVIPCCSSAVRFPCSAIVCTGHTAVDTILFCPSSAREA